jgi:hypothetical protein
LCTNEDPSFYAQDLELDGPKMIVEWTVDEYGDDQVIIDEMGLLKVDHNMGSGVLIMTAGYTGLTRLGTSSSTIWIVRIVGLTQWMSGQRLWDMTSQNRFSAIVISGQMLIIMMATRRTFTWAIHLELSNYSSLRKSRQRANERCIIQ